MFSREHDNGTGLYEAKTRVIVFQSVEEVRSSLSESVLSFPS